jgi:hypothetical protein
VTDLWLDCHVATSSSSQTSNTMISSLLELLPRGLLLRPSATDSDSHGKGRRRGSKDPDSISGKVICNTRTGNVIAWSLPFFCSSCRFNCLSYWLSVPNHRCIPGRSGVEGISLLFLALPIASFDKYPCLCSLYSDYPCRLIGRLQSASS